MGNQKKLTKQDINKVYFRNLFALQFGWQGEHITKALDGVDLSINPGEFVAIIGTSGSGKSTLLHMMGGLDIPTSGEIIINGKLFSEKNE